MNDCIFSFTDICEGCTNGRCKKYISANSKEGSDILTEYTKEVDKAIEPVIEAYKKKYFESEVE